jgi:hypothetical protein
MTDIKCIQNINATRQRRYDTELLDIHNGHATVRGDLTSRRSKTATVSDDPSTRTISYMAEQRDMTFIRSSTSSLAIPS